MADEKELWQAPYLLGLSTTQAAALYRELAPAAIDEIQGEWGGYDHIEATEAAFAAAGARKAAEGQAWLGKAFQTDENGVGYGYNRILMPDGRILRHDKFSVAPGLSVVDGKPTLVLDYRVYDNPAGNAGLVDEVRRVNANLFLCIMTKDDEVGGRTEPDYFVLGGPRSPWVGEDDPAAEIRQLVSR